MTTEEEIASLKAQVAELTNRVGVVEDIQAIRTLHFKYGYYMDKWLFPEIVDLFAEDGEFHFLNGVFKGKQGVKRFFGDGLGIDGPTYGILTDHLHVQDIVDVAPDRGTAMGRFRCFLMGGVHESRRESTPIPAQFWEGGVYENTYVRENGVWKIRVLNYNLSWQAEYEKGWARSEKKLLMVSRFTKTYPDDPRGPDSLKSAPARHWPDATMVPFHYPHPVTGEKGRYSL
ncbi:MAG: nuclear transport factor 2 family protein [Acidobacteria bacterium]|nr:nuclear transport factor 2 family protein [Acidobacteriota bacterium]